MAYVRYLGDGGRFCILLIVLSGGKLAWDTHVALFRVEKKFQNCGGGGEDLCLDAVLLEHHVYEGFSASVGCDFRFPTEVFIMYVISLSLSPCANIYVSIKSYG